MSYAAGQAEPAGHCPPLGLECAFAEHQAELLGTLYYMVGNIEDARDAFQETFIKCWKHRHELSEVRNLKAWIFRIALNTARDARQTAWRRKRQPLPAHEDAMVSRQEAPHVPLERGEDLAQLRAAIEQLRAEEKEVFLLRQNGMMKYEEIAEAMGIPLGTVKTRMRLALSRLKAAMETH